MFIDSISATVELSADYRKKEQEDSKEPQNRISDTKPDWLECWIKIAQQDAKILAG